MIERLNRRDVLVLFVGDIAVLYLSLWLTLALRQFALPDLLVWLQHAAPFTILFAVWIIVFFIAGLYEKHTSILKSRLPNVIFNAQVANSVIAILFFYLIPYFGITPKVFLFIYLIVSFVLVLAWRRHSASILVERKQQPAVLIGSGDEMHELMKEVNENSRYGMRFTSSVDLNEIDGLDFKNDVTDLIYAEGITTVVIDTKNDKISPILSKLYNLIFSRVNFIDMHKVYEEIFDRVPLSLVQYSWFLENISATRRFTYEFVKRILDIVIALPIFIISLIFYPFVWLVIKIDDGGQVLIGLERIGKNNKRIRIFKFRTMTGVDEDKPDLTTEHTVTRIGHFLRATRIDEIPQLWNVLSGSLTLIGPRPEIPALVSHYEEEIPYYNVRHLITPGLSGWGQIKDSDVPREDADVEKTRRKLSYDLYYIKNRSLLLDMRIVLKTIKTLLSRSGR